MAVDNDGNIWWAQYSHDCIYKLHPDGSVYDGFPKGTAGGSGDRGVAVTPADNNVWVANSLGNTVSRLDNDGNVRKVIGVGNTPTGVAVDAEGKVWVTNYGSSNVMRIDPAGGADELGAVDLTVSLGSGAGPYNYSDMTGIVALQAAAQGTWTVVHNSEEAGTEWGIVSWNGDQPEGTNIKVQVRASDTQGGLAGETFVEVNNGVIFSGIFGQYIEIRTTLERDTGVDATPILYDLTVEIRNLPPTANAGPDQIVEQTDLAGTVVTLDGSNSIDDGRIQPLTYEWTWVDGSATGATPTISLPLGITPIALAVNDGQFEDTDIVQITVIDTTPPILTVPGDVIVEQETADGTTVPLVATATDICDADVEITNDAPAIFPLGMTRVTFTATDDSGNVSTGAMTVKVQDTTAPDLKVTCTESVNPHGNIIPGKNRDKNGNKPNVNPDGFYEISFEVTDICDAAPETYVGTADNPLLFSITSGMVVKFTEDRDAVPEIKKIGSFNDKADSVEWHIILPSDPVISSVDDSGNIASCTTCLVPPPPM